METGETTGCFSARSYFMKNKPSRAQPASRPSEEDIRSYAYHLYQQSNCRPGQDLGNWLEAIACLSARVPSERSNTRLHHHLSRPAVSAVVPAAATHAPATASARVIRRARRRSRQ
jgi:hypothetical protein